MKIHLRHVVRKLEWSTIREAKVMGRHEKFAELSSSLISGFFFSTNSDPKLNLYYFSSILSLFRIC